MWQIVEYEVALQRNTLYSSTAPISPFCLHSSPTSAKGCQFYNRPLPLPVRLPNLVHLWTFWSLYAFMWDAHESQGDGMAFILFIFFCSQFPNHPNSSTYWVDYIQKELLERSGRTAETFSLLWTWKCLAKTELVLTFDSITSNLLTPQLGELNQEKFSNFLVSHASWVTEQDRRPLGRRHRPTWWHWLRFKPYKSWIPFIKIKSSIFLVWTRDRRERLNQHS